MTAGSHSLQLYLLGAHGKGVEACSRHESSMNVQQIVPCRRQSPLSSPNIFKRFEAWNKRFRLHGADCTFIKSVDVCGSYVTQARPTAAYYVPGDVMKLQAQKLSLRGNCLVRDMDCLASCNGIFPSAKVWNPLPLPTRMLVVWGDRPAVGGP